MRLSRLAEPWPQRPWHAAAAAFAAAALATGYYLEWVVGLEPCALCQSQRLCFYLAGFAAAVGCAGASRRWWLAAASVGLAAAAAGGALAVRQLWLQSLPEDQAPACGPTFAYMLEAMPATRVLEALLLGDGNCAQVSFRALGLSLPAWSLLGFVGLAALNAGLATDAARRARRQPAESA